jgi:hypothetical protein
MSNRKYSVTPWNDCGSSQLSRRIAASAQTPSLRAARATASALSDLHAAEPDRTAIRLQRKRALFQFLVLDIHRQRASVVHPAADWPDIVLEYTTLTDAATIRPGTKANRRVMTAPLGRRK